MPDRDPRTDPREGDELQGRGTAKRIVVDLIRDGWVYWRVTDGRGGLLSMWRKPLEQWRALAPDECEAPHD